MSRKYRIAMVAACPFPYPRGTPVRVHRMAEALAHRGHEVHVVTYHHGDRIEDAPFYIRRIREVSSYRKLSPGPTYQKLLVLDPLLTAKLNSVVKEIDADVIHAHHYEGLIASVLVRRFTSVPVVYDAHTLLESELPFYRMGLPQKWLRALGTRIDRFMPSRAEHIIAVTERIRSRIVEAGGVDRSKTSVIQNGVEADFFKAAAEGRKIRRDAVPRIIYAGNLSAYQGIELLLHAFCEVAKSRSATRLVLVTGSRFDPYEALANELGIRRKIDIVNSEFDRLPEYLAEADVAANPRTECDGIPQKLLNYMAAGLPVVSFAGSAKNIKDGRNGLVVEDKNIAAFASAVNTLLDDRDQAERIGRNGRDYVVANHTWEGTAEKTEEVYAKVYEERGA